MSDAATPGRSAPDAGPSGANPAKAGAAAGRRHGDRAPGDPRSTAAGAVRAYAMGLAFAAALTAASFYASYTHLVYGPAVPVVLIVLALAQVGVHLVYFLHLSTAPDNVNNAMALAFGALIVLLLVGGTLRIMAHMNGTMMPVGGMAPMPR